MVLLPLYFCPRFVLHSLHLPSRYQGEKHIVRFTSNLWKSFGAGAVWLVYAYTDKARGKHGAGRPVGRCVVGKPSRLGVRCLRRQESNRQIGTR